MNFDELLDSIPADPFYGYYVNKDGRNASISDLALISHIEDNLYVGGCMQGVDLGDFFDYVFSMYKWEQYKVDPSTKVYTVTMYDSNAEPDALEIDSIATQVVNALEQGGNVLVHCQAGINRSNLIAATALTLWKGLSAADAIDVLRERRHRNVLANSTFERFLLNGSA